jgi:hypothetical protein
MAEDQAKGKDYGTVFKIDYISFVSKIPKTTVTRLKVQMSTRHIIKKITLDSLCYKLPIQTIGERCMQSCLRTCGRFYPPHIPVFIHASSKDHTT